MKKYNKNQGITIIALVITIIVMLILVGVSISIAVNGGLFSYAGNAVADTENEKNTEKDIANGGIEIDGEKFDSINEYLEGVPPNPEEKFSEIYTENTTITEKSETGEILYTAVVPKGFAVGKSDGINTIEGGLVITDKVNSEGQSTGNEFVWIPVEVKDTDKATSIASFYRSNWSNNGRGTTKYTDKTGSSYNEPLTTDGYTYANEEKEYNDMLKSVYLNKGFYIGRYEAGTEKPRTSSTTGPTENWVVQRDKYPYIFVSWGNEMYNYTDDVSTYGKGALYLCKNFYTEKDNVGVTSTLCYGVMWDAMLEFISTEKNVVDSTTWGNHENNTGITWEIKRVTAKWTTNPSSDKEWTTVGEKSKEKTSSSSILLTTGANENFSAKNIYDVAGNAYEWTNEAKSTNNRIRRGGAYTSKGDASAGSASGRLSFRPNICYEYNGFRPALYITNNA